MHLLFFYAVVVAVLYRAGELRKLCIRRISPGILIMIGIFAAWAIPYWQAIDGRESGANLVQSNYRPFDRRRFQAPAAGSCNIPARPRLFSALDSAVAADSRSRIRNLRERNLRPRSIWGCAVPFLVVNLLPGALPRYSMPAWSRLPGSWRWFWRRPEVSLAWQMFGGARLRLAACVGTAVVAGLLLVIYAVAVVPSCNSRSKVKPIAAQIDASCRTTSRFTRSIPIISRSCST